MSFVIGILTVVSIKSMHLQNGQPTPAFLALNVIFSLFAAGVGGFICGLIAPARPLEHGYVLACVMLVMGALSYAHFHGSQPGWYQLVLLLGPPACAVGGAAVCAVSAKRQAV